MNFSPIVLFVYNRPWHTKQTVKALKNNILANKSDLFIFSDGPKNDADKNNVNQVRDYIENIDGFKSVKIAANTNNSGLANSVIAGVSEVIAKYNKVIVLEDDLITSANFLKFINEALNFYEEDQRVYSITGYNHAPSLIKVPYDYTDDVFFCPRASSWGWGTWKDRWESVDWEVKDFNQFIKNKDLKNKFNKAGNDMTHMLELQMKAKIDSWAIRWSYHHFKNNAFCVFPVQSYLNNIGLDGTGIHGGKDAGVKYLNKTLNNRSVFQFSQNIKVNEQIMKEFRKVYKKDIKYYIKKVISLLSFTVKDER